MEKQDPKLEDYTVGWISALAVELAAAITVLDDEYRSDDNEYTLGRIGEHKVVIACLPAGGIGTTWAATVATHMASRFPSLRFCLMVGVAGGVPSKEHDIRLGDVVISEPSDQNGGAVQYLFGKTGKDGKVKRTGWLNSPPTVLLTALKKLRTNDMIGRINFEEKMAPFAPLPTFQHQTGAFDTLYEATYDHVAGPTCEDCGNENFVQRSERQNSTPILHFGTIASDNQVIKDGMTRDKYSEELGGVLCFEMEAAGIMNTLPCLVIRGICDYADSHKNKRWQPYASATAAVAAKELLKLVPASLVSNTPTLNSVLGIPEDVLATSEIGRRRAEGSSHQIISNGGVGFNGDIRFSGSQTIGGYKA